MKKLFTLLLVALLATSAAWAENIYVKVTSLDQLVPGKKCILAHQNGATNKSHSAAGCLYYATTSTNNRWFMPVYNSGTGNLDNNYTEGVIDLDFLNAHDRGGNGPVTVFTINKVDGEEDVWTLYAENAKFGETTLSGLYH